MKEEIFNLRVLVDAVAQKVVVQVKRNDLSGLKELLWEVSTNLLAEFLKRED